MIRHRGANVEDGSNRKKVAATSIESRKQEQRLELGLQYSRLGVFLSDLHVKMFLRFHVDPEVP